MVRDAIRVLTEPSLDEVLEFCGRAPVERVFLEDVARRGLGRFVAAAGRGGGRVTALCHVGANIVPSGEGCDCFADAAARSRSRMVIGEERAVGELWAASASRLPAQREELRVDPLAADAEGFRWRTRAQIEEGRSWLWLEDDVVLFKAEASAWTPEAVQVQQVWVDPEARGRGHGLRGMR